jgi:putative pyruvate formate lyase activating enzyme
MKYPGYSPCGLCPRRCAARRLPAAAAGAQDGYCGETAELRIACASIHRGEEPPLTGQGGSGAVFVSGCNLGCVFCQNHQITGRGRSGVSALGRTVDTEEFVRICLALRERGAENINIVTGSHAVPALAAGLSAAKDAGLGLPVLWNSSAYEIPETLELLAGLIDVFLPDLKTLDSALAARYFNAPDYPEAACAAIRKMLELRRPEPRPPLPPVIIRHLVLPGHLDSTRQVLRWFAEYGAEYGARRRALLSLMFQYTPARLPNGGGPEPDRYVSEAEYDTILGWLDDFGIEDGFCQELVPGATDWLPDFEKINPFPSDLSVPVWHWREGFLD